MQTLKKNLLTNKIVLKFQKKNFSQSWATNSTTGEAKPRHIVLAPTRFNGWTCFSNNKTQVRGRVDHTVNNKNKDFPSVADRLAFLTGQPKI